MSYSEKLKSPKWQKKRLEILQRDNWTCTYCSDTEKQLHVHHLKYTAKEPHEEPSENLITVCEMCHHIFEYTKTINKGDVYIGEVLGISKRTQSYVAIYKEWVLIFGFDKEQLFAGTINLLHDCIEIHTTLTQKKLS